METVEEIDTQIRTLHLRKDEIEKAHFKSVVFPQLRLLLGKTFAYRNNSYSCPERPSDYWDVFRKVVRVVESDGAAWLLFEECSLDRDRKPSLTVEAMLHRHADMNDGWKPCTAKEYELARARVMAAIDSPHNYAANLAS